MRWLIWLQALIRRIAFLVRPRHAFSLGFPVAVLPCRARLPRLGAVRFSPFLQLQSWAAYLARYPPVCWNLNSMI